MISLEVDIGKQWVRIGLIITRPYELELKLFRMDDDIRQQMVIHLLELRFREREREREREIKREWENGRELGLGVLNEKAEALPRLLLLLQLPKRLTRPWHGQTNACATQRLSGSSFTQQLERKRRSRKREEKMREINIPSVYLFRRRRLFSCRRIVASFVRGSSSGGGV